MPAVADTRITTTQLHVSLAKNVLTNLMLSGIK